MMVSAPGVISQLAGWLGADVASFLPGDATGFLTGATEETLAAGGGTSAGAAAGGVNTAGVAGLCAGERPAAPLAQGAPAS